MKIHLERVEYPIGIDPSEPEVGAGEIVGLNQLVIALLGKEFRITTSAQIRDVISGNDEGFQRIRLTEAKRLINAKQ